MDFPTTITVGAVRMTTCITGKCFRDECVYIGCNDVAESVVTIRSPYCGYNFHNVLSYENVHMIISLPTKRI